MNEAAKATPEKASQVNTQMDAMDKELVRADALRQRMFCELADVLTDATAPLGTTPDDRPDDKKPDEQALVPLAARLRSYVAVLSGLSDEYDNLKSRLEL